MQQQPATTISAYYSSTNMIAENGYLMPASSAEHLLNVVIFSIFHIATRDVPYFDHRCVASNAPYATQSQPSVSPQALPRARHQMDEVTRWLIALLCFVDAKYDTCTDVKGNYTGL